MNTNIHRVRVASSDYRWAKWQLNGIGNVCRRIECAVNVQNIPTSTYGNNANCMPWVAMWWYSECIPVSRTNHSHFWLTLCHMCLRFCHSMFVHVGRRTPENANKLILIILNAKIFSRNWVSYKHGMNERCFGMFNRVCLNDIYCIFQSQIIHLYVV